MILLYGLTVLKYLQIQAAVTFSANTLNTLQLNRGNGAEALTGKVKSVITFDTALTDAELECLTTI